jgi:hypothetical protein
MVVARWGCAFLSLGLAGCVGSSILGGLDETGGTEDDGGDDDDGQTSAPGDDSGDDSGGGDDGPPPVDGPPRIDFLFVIDNSGSMGPAQAALAHGLDTLVAGLDAADGVSYRIGVTTTDNGNPLCGSTGPEAGRLQLTSCRERQNEFIFPNPPTDATEVACLDICPLDEIPVVATAVEGDPELRPRPWIEGGAGGTNLDGVSVADALRCVMPQGIAGCGFESPLESSYKALLRSQQVSDGQFGFMRPDAHLVVVFVTDETDCSYTNEAESIFYNNDQDGNEVFWEPAPGGVMETDSPTSAVCWNAGIECTGEPGTNEYDECHAANKSIDGVVGVSDDDAVLYPIARYRDFLLELQQVKRATSDASVFLFGIVGVPVGWPETQFHFEDAGDPEFQYNFGINPACGATDDGRTGVPAVRFLELAQTFANPIHDNVFSICGDIPSSIDPILQSVLAHVQ